MMGRPKVFFLVLVSILILCYNVLAEEEVKRTLNFVDAVSGESIERAVARVNLLPDNNGTSINRILLVKEGELELLMSSSNYKGWIILDDPKTDAPDYYFFGDVVFDGKSAIVHFIPIAYVNGKVFDHLKNLVNGASLDFRCDKLSTIIFPERTDKYGSFNNYVPIGKCSIIATFGGYVGQEKIQAERGESIEIIINLEDKSESQNMLLFVIIPILVVVGLFFVYWKRIRKKTKKEVEKPKIKKKLSVSRKIDSVMNTLRDKEKQIVQFLLDNKNQTNSAQIRYHLKIPKTSLARILVNLENKKIVEIERFGKLKRVRISEWLLKK